MNAQVKLKPDDTRARIIETAEALFRRLGYAKTAVADIAGELGMSPANVYRFFPSKNAIVEAICQRCLNELHEKVWAVARGRGPAGDRLEQLFREILDYHLNNLITEQRVNDIVLVGMENSWEAIRAHTEVIRTVIELIVRDGIASEEFEAVDPRATSIVIKRSMMVFCHPLMVAQCMQDGHDLDAEVRESARFVLRAITSRR